MQRKATSFIRTLHSSHLPPRQSIPWTSPFPRPGPHLQHSVQAFPCHRTNNSKTTTKSNSHGLSGTSGPKDAADDRPTTDILHDKIYWTRVLYDGNIKIGTCLKLPICSTHRQSSPRHLIIPSVTYQPVIQSHQKTPSTEAPAISPSHYRFRVGRSFSYPGCHRFSSVALSPNDTKSP